MASRNGENNNTPQIPCDLWMDVFSWLPAKSLMRFKSVSKYWLSLITNPMFADVHHTRSYVRQGGVVLVKLPWRYQIVRPRDPFLMIDSSKKDPIKRVVAYKPVPYTNNNVTSNMVNGLICFYHEQDPDKFISVYNLTTRENLPLPPPASDATTYIWRHCYLGFDPVNKVYKVIHFCYFNRVVSEDRVYQCEVFTLGGGHENRWRPMPTCDNRFWFVMPDLCNEGFMYWSVRTKRFIVRFSVKHEQFDFINYPKEEISSGRCTDLTIVREHLCLVETPYLPRCSCDTVITLWRLLIWKDNHNPVWTKQLIKFYVYNDGLSFLSCTNFGLLTVVRCSPIPNHVIIDLYELTPGKHKELIINNPLGFLQPNSVFCPSKLVENIMPLKNLYGRNILAM